MIKSEAKLWWNFLRANFPTMVWPQYISFEMRVLEETSVCPLFSRTLRPVISEGWLILQRFGGEACSRQKNVKKGKWWWCVLILQNFIWCFTTNKLLFTTCLLNPQIFLSWLWNLKHSVCIKKTAVEKTLQLWHSLPTAGWAITIVAANTFTYFTTTWGSKCPKGTQE